MAQVGAATGILLLDLGTAPLSGASKVDRLDYIVRSTTSIHAVFTVDYS